jgi:hypothetical protein
MSGPYETRVSELPGKKDRIIRDPYKLFLDMLTHLFATIQRTINYECAP